MISRKNVLITVALGAWVAIAAASCGGSGTTSPSPTPTPAPTAAGADVTIQIVGMAGPNSYSPNPGSVKAGQTVSWHNADAVAHTATGSGFDTGSIPAGSTSAPMAFTTAAALSYHCTFHPSMTGTLNVTP